MTRTSTEPVGGSERAFRRALAATIVVLVALCALFLGLGYLQGPKLSSAQVDLTGVTAQSGQQLRLFANQAVTQVKPSQVTVTPKTAFTVTTTGDLIAVQFADRLAYATEYSVRVAGVTSVYLPQGSTIDYSFTTASPTLYYLDRGAPDDEIIRTSLRGPGGDPVYSARHIQSFAALGGILAVVTLADDHTSALDLVSIGDGLTERLKLPDAGVIEKLDAAASGTMLGFTLSSAKAGLGQANFDTLFTLDLQAGRAVTPVLGLDGKPLHVLGWQFIPGTTSILALNIDRSLLLIDPTAKSVLPLGQFSEFGRISADGTVAVMADAAGPVEFTLSDGTQKRLQAAPLDGRKAFLGQAEVLPGGGRVEKIVIPDASGTRFASYLVYDDGTASRELYRTVDDGGSISDFTISPNGQYVAIETVPDVSASVSDGYFYDARSTSVTTVIVDIATGQQVRSVEGFALHW